MYFGGQLFYLRFWFLNSRTRTKETCGGVFIYLLHIEFIEFIQHNKSIKVSSVQFYYTLLVYNVVFSLFKVKSFSINTYFSLFYPFPSLIIIHFSLSMRIFLSIFFIISEELSNICQSLFSFHDSVCILFVCLFCSLYYTYK